VTLAIAKVQHGSHSTSSRTAVWFLCSGSMAITAEPGDQIRRYSWVMASPYETDQSLLCLSELPLVVVFLPKQTTLRGCLVHSRFATGAILYGCFLGVFTKGN
jgi:hypothetical protein